MRFTNRKNLNSMNCVQGTEGAIEQQKQILESPALQEISVRMCWISFSQHPSCRVSRSQLRSPRPSRSLKRRRSYLSMKLCVDCFQRCMRICNINRNSKESAIILVYVLLMPDVLRIARASSRIPTLEFWKAMASPLPNVLGIFIMSQVHGSFKIAQENW